MIETNAPPPTAGWEQRAYLAIRQGRDVLVAPLAWSLSLLRVPAWAVSLAGVGAAVASAVVAPSRPELALPGFALAVLADLLDGAVARRQDVPSGRGKWVDQLCDLATFAALAAAAVRGGLAPASAATAAVGLNTALITLRLAQQARREPLAFRSAPRAGFLGHAPKFVFFVAYPLALLGGAEEVELALWAVALTSAAVLGFSLAVELTSLRGGRRPADPGPPAPGTTRNPPAPRLPPAPPRPR